VQLELEDEELLLLNDTCFSGVWTTDGGPPICGK
jgi:hypothetical protein